MYALRHIPNLGYENRAYKPHFKPPLTTKKHYFCSDMPRPVLIQITAILLALLPALAARGQQPQDPYSIAESQYMAGEYSKAILTSLDGLSKEPALSDSAAAVELYSILGASYSRLGDFDKAADYMVLCYNYDRNSGDAQGLSSSLINLASVYVYAGKPQIAEQYALQAIDNEKTLNRPLKLAMAYGKACDVYHALGTQDKALMYANLAVSTATQAYDDALQSQADSTAIQNAENALAIRRSQRAYPLVALERYSEALEDLNYSYAVFNRNGNRQSLAIVNFQLAQLHMSQGNTAKAVKYGTEAYQVTQSLNDQPLLEKICRTMASLVSKTDPAKALEYMESASVISDSIRSREDRNRLALYEIEFQTERNRHTIELLNQKNSQQHTQLLLLAVITVLMLAIAVLLTIFYRRSQRDRREMERLNRQKDMLMSIISHDLRSPAIAQHSALRSFSNVIDQLPPDQLKSLSQELEQQAATEVELIENVLRWSRSKSSDYHIVPVRFNLVDAVRDTVAKYSYTASQKDLTITIDGLESLTVFSDRDTFMVILRNLLSNAIKFSFPGGKIEITTQLMSGDKARVTVTDHGIGLTGQEAALLFNPDNRFVRKGSMGESGSGLGLVVCQDMAAALGGTISLDSKPGEYTSFSITIPNSTQDGQEN